LLVYDFMKNGEQVSIAETPLPIENHRFNSEYTLEEKKPFSVSYTHTHTNTYIHAHIHKHARARAHTHTHTHTKEWAENSL
jgi:hypothetical protein